MLAHEYILNRHMHDYVQCRLMHLYVDVYTCTCAFSTDANNTHILGRFFSSCLVVLSCFSTCFIEIALSVPKFLKHGDKVSFVLEFGRDNNNTNVQATKQNNIFL